MLTRTRRLSRLLIARPLGEGEREELAAALAAEGLPTADLEGPGREFFVFRDPRGTLLGYAGLEVLGADALLRSLVVVPEMRDRGLGVAIVDRMMALALRRGVRRLYVLATAAAAFFARRGFVVLDREAAPTAIAGTTEFAELCPASAVLMSLDLT